VKVTLRKNESDAQESEHESRVAPLPWTLVEDLPAVLSVDMCAWFTTTSAGNFNRINQAVILLAIKATSSSWLDQVRCYQRPSA